MTLDSGPRFPEVSELEPSWVSFSKDQFSLLLVGRGRSWCPVAWGLMGLQSNFLPSIFRASPYPCLQRSSASRFWAGPGLCARNSLPPCLHALFVDWGFSSALQLPFILVLFGLKMLLTSLISHRLYCCALCPWEFIAFLFLYCHFRRLLGNSGSKLMYLVFHV